MYGFKLKTPQHLNDKHKELFLPSTQIKDKSTFKIYIRKSLQKNQEYLVLISTSKTYLNAQAGSLFNLRFRREPFQININCCLWQDDGDHLQTSYPFMFITTQQTMELPFLHVF